LGPLVLQIAAEVIGKSCREHPADAVLREALASRRLPTKGDREAISKAIFDYFRWRGWMDMPRPLPAQIRKAQDLAQNFAADPESFSDLSLIERVVPGWLRGQMDIIPAWARAIQAEPKLWLRARKGQGRELARKLRGAELVEHLLADAMEYRGGEDLFKRPEFHAGDFEIQDVASQAVGWLCAPRPGETWWDACAGEGGKLLHLSDLMENKGLIWASDRAEWRLKKLKRRTARAKVFNYRAALWDGGAKLPTKTKFDGVLVDAPCSGVGTWQRNPHARWTTSLQDVQELALLQQRLLAHAAPGVKPGGKLIYAVCTLTQAETEDTARHFNQTQPEFEPWLLPELHGVDGRVLTNAATLTIWPQDLGGNGMFVAAWRRKPSV
jgi:16S rRNA (cytosine967-C5)-methyltransferase